MFRSEDYSVLLSLTICLGAESVCYLPLKVRILSLHLTGGGGLLYWLLPQLKICGLYDTIVVLLALEPNAVFGIRLIVR